MIGTRGRSKGHAVLDMRRKPCPHLSGYWIQEGKVFRCYDCGRQVSSETITANTKRKIEVWIGLTK
jgi:tRNA(Ile2) C34 agmatinyltransferase TiaS